MFERVRARAAEALAFNPREVVALTIMGLLVVIGASLAYVRSRPAAAEPAAPASTAPAFAGTASSDPSIAPVARCWATLADARAASSMTSSSAPAGTSIVSRTLPLT